MTRFDDMTLKPEIRALLGAYATGILSPAEERRLYEAALENQGLFNELAHEELVREALADKAFRSRLQRRLRELNEEPRRAFHLGFLDLFKSPAFALSAAAALALLVIGVPQLTRMRSPEGPVAQGDAGSLVIVPKGLQSSSEDGSPVQRKGAFLEQIWIRASIEPDAVVALELDRPGQVPEYPAGEPLRISFTLSRDAAVLILDEGPDGVVSQFFPSEYRPSPLVCAQERVELPRAGREPWLVAANPGRHRLRLLVLPAGSDPLEAAVDGQERPSAAELEYQVLEHQEGAR